MKRIVIAAGCFWGVEAYFKRLKGVIATKVGYVNGNMENPKYEDLLNKKATHAEACAILYDDDILTFKTILEHMFRIIEPTSINRQGNDIGVQYRTGIYYVSDEDRIIAEGFIAEKQKNYQNNITVEVAPETGFYPAENYHQDYLDKNPDGYCHIDLNLLGTDE
ncbi:MAG: peptide-methionine (S)-S-oxide reductase MsrA [Bacilli bacterium]|nr:peptide-methionine (S)-S-oxide reductase MsrA [Bacilli bacterium]MDD4076547.1 peptide-methionine (S)-S-oxide reductase MsrA [Bacilli bacterium]MDD4387745.1 peptide-methionine (S)-S-oxide reductase MsrA [Bacilli bacterium]